jgi:hypothetical protein
MLCHLVALAFLCSAVNGQIESPSFPSDAPTAHPLKPDSGGVDAPSSIESALLGNSQTPETRNANLIDLDQFNLKEFEDAVESSKPDNIDNDAIQELIDQFLNKGTLEQDQNKKINTNAQKLINSSSYWDTSDLKVSLSCLEILLSFLGKAQYQRCKDHQEMAGGL